MLNLPGRSGGEVNQHGPACVPHYPFRRSLQTSNFFAHACVVFDSGRKEERAERCRKCFECGGVWEHDCMDRIARAPLTSFAGSAQC